MPRSAHSAWPQDEKYGADMNQTHSLDQDQLTYILKQNGLAEPTYMHVEWQSTYRLTSGCCKPKTFEGSLLSSICDNTWLIQSPYKKNILTFSKLEMPNTFWQRFSTPDYR